MEPSEWPPRADPAGTRQAPAVIGRGRVGCGTEGGSLDHPLSPATSPGPPAGAEEAPRPEDLLPFVEALRSFCRTVPIYPEGHMRIAAALKRLKTARKAFPESLDLAMGARSLLVGGVSLDLQHEGTRAVH